MGGLHSQSWRRTWVGWGGVKDLKGGYGRGFVHVVVFRVAVAWWEAPLRLVTQHCSDCRTIGDGRQASPSCRHERAKKQDLGLDASSHFAGWRGLAFIKRPSKKKREGGGFCLATPLSPPQNCTLFEFPHFLNSFLCRECVQLQRATRLLEDYRSTPAQKKLEGLRLLGAGPAQKAGMKRGICGPFSFWQKTLSSIKITVHCTCTATASFKPLEQITQFQHVETLLGRGDHLKHHLLQRFIIWLLTCILHFHLRWLHTFLHSGTIQWAGSILDLLNKLKM